MSELNRGIVAGLMITAAVFGATSLAFSTVANAIECSGRYQIVNGSKISTPYCEDNYLAHVARGYGAHVSNSTIRNNPATKEEICRLVGHDNRVQGICDDTRHGKRRWLN